MRSSFFGGGGGGKVKETSEDRKQEVRGVTK